MLESDAMDVIVSLSNGPDQEFRGVAQIDTTHGVLNLLHPDDNDQWMRTIFAPGIWQTVTVTQPEDDAE